jgi:hypothetical protein
MGRDETDASCEQLAADDLFSIARHCGNRPTGTEFVNRVDCLTVTKLFPLPNKTNQSRNTTVMVLDSFYKFIKILPGQNRCMVVLALTYPKFTDSFILRIFVPALSIQFKDIGDVSQVLFMLGIAVLMNK